MVVAFAFALAMVEAPAADGPSVGVLPVHIEAELAAPDRRDAAEHFSQGLARSGFAIEPVRVEGADTCAEPTCYQNIAARAATPQLAGASVTQEGPDYHVRAFIIDGGSGETVVSAEGVCEICGMQELDEMIEGLAARLRSKLSTTVRPTRLSVATTPSGATVLVDGISVGTTPLDVEVAPGAHEVEVQRDGYRSVAATEEVQLGATATASYRLQRAPNIPAWLPWTAIAVGAGATVSGIALLAIDGNEIERDCNADIDGRCQYLHNTLPGGLVLTIGGVATLGTGIALAIVRSRRESPQRIRASAWLHTPGLSLSGRF
jgi:hypothetical protein